MDPTLCLQTVEFKVDPINVVALPCGRAPDRRRCLPASPGANILRRFVAGVPVGAERGQLWSVRRNRHAFELRAEECVESLRASVTCRSLRPMGKAAKAWNIIFLRRNPGAQPIDHVPAYDIMRKMRIRLDLVSMLAFRV